MEGKGIYNRSSQVQAAGFGAVLIFDTPVTSGSAQVVRDMATAGAPPSVVTKCASRDERGKRTNRDHPRLERYR
jgi:hypothetical protein